MRREDGDSCSLRGETGLYPYSVTRDGIGKECLVAVRNGTGREIIGTQVGNGSGT